MKLSGKIFRFVILIFIPLFFVIKFIYIPLSPGECFNFENSSVPFSQDALTNTFVKQSISKYIDEKIKVIQLVDPIIPISDRWFKFDLFFKNNLKVAIVVTRPQSYNIATTTFFVQTQEGTSTVYFKEEVLISSNKEVDQLNNVVQAFNFITNNGPIVVGPNEYVSIQTDPSLGGICVRVLLGKNYLFLMYLEILIIFIGILILIKEALRLISVGFRKYFGLSSS